jgi:hypothetical protein
MTNDGNFDELYNQLKHMSTKLKTTQAKNQKLQHDTKQLKSFETLSSLLEKSADTLACGPDCQHDKKQQRLKQKFLDAKTNVQTAPDELKENRKNYYVFSKGEGYYDDWQEKTLEKKARRLAHDIKTNLDQELAKCDTLNAYLVAGQINMEHVDALYASFLEKNMVTRKQVKGTKGDILTNQRKTYYENEEIYHLKKWYNIFFYLYYILLFFFAVCSYTTLFNPKYYAMLVALAAFPFIVEFVVKYVYNWLVFFYTLFPHSVYSLEN